MMNRIIALAAGLMAVSCAHDIAAVQGLDKDWPDDADFVELYEFPEYARYFELPLESAESSEGEMFPTESVMIVPEGCRSWLRAVIREQVEADIAREEGALLCIQIRENTGGRSREAAVMVGGRPAVRIRQFGSGEKGSLRRGLMALYDALDGPGWAVSTGWCSDRPLQEWYGVRPSKAVVGDLFGMKETVCSGTSDTWSLVLDDNGLHGIVPREFWEACRHLDTISLAGGELKGSVLPDLIWHEGLRRLCFSDTGIGGGLSEAIAAASHLEVIDFQNCNLTGELPLSIISLRQLKVLDLGANSISGNLPERIGELSELTELRLGANFELCGTLPESFYDLTALQSFSIGCTKVGGTLSPAIGRLRNLRYFCISFCEFEGRIPEELGTIPGIGICCEGNYFTQLPEFIRYRGFQNEWIVTGGITPDWVPFFQRDRKDGRPEDLYSMGQYGIVYNYDYCHLLPLPVWAGIRYGLLRWDMFHSYDDLKSPEYPSADDLQYPADEYYYDGEHWRHPALEYPAAEYYFDGSKWLHDASCPWDKKYEPATMEDTGTW